jgi:hypothetical protein
MSVYLGIRRAIDSLNFRFRIFALSHLLFSLPLSMFSFASEFPRLCFTCLQHNTRPRSRNG